MTKVTPASSTSATTSRASPRVGAITFSAKTCLPALAAAGMTSRWATVGVVTTTPSTSSRERSPLRSSWKGTPRLEASTCPRSLSSLTKHALASLQLRYIGINAVSLRQFEFVFLDRHRKISMSLANLLITSDKKRLRQKQTLLYRCMAQALLGTFC